MSTPARSYASRRGGFASGQLASGLPIEQRVPLAERFVMQIRVSPGTASSLKAGALVVPVFSDARLDGAAQGADQELGGAIADVLASGEIKGKTQEAGVIHVRDLAVKRVLLVGLGDRAKFEPQALAKYAGTAGRYLGTR